MVAWIPCSPCRASEHSTIRSRVGSTCRRSPGSSPAAPSKPRRIASIQKDAPTRPLSSRRIGADGARRRQPRARAGRAASAPRTRDDPPCGGSRGRSRAAAARCGSPGSRPSRAAAAARRSRRCGERSSACRKDVRLAAGRNRGQRGLRREPLEPPLGDGDHSPPASRAPARAPGRARASAASARPRASRSASSAARSVVSSASSSASTSPRASASRRPSSAGRASPRSAIRRVSARARGFARGSGCRWSTVRTATTGTLALFRARVNYLSSERGLRRPLLRALRRLGPRGVPLGRGGLDPRCRRCSPSPRRWRPRRSTVRSASPPHLSASSERRAASALESRFALLRGLDAALGARESASRRRHAPCARRVRASLRGARPARFGRGARRRSCRASRAPAGAVSCPMTSPTRSGPWCASAQREWAACDHRTLPAHARLSRPGPRAPGCG